MWFVTVLWIKKLVDGDILNIDVTTIVDGWYGDTSRMFKIGKVESEHQNLLMLLMKP